MIIKIEISHEELDILGVSMCYLFLIAKAANQSEFAKKVDALTDRLAAATPADVNLDENDDIINLVDDLLTGEVK